MPLDRDLPSDHQHDVLELVDERGDGVIRRFTDTTIATLRAMQRRHWVTLHETTVYDETTGEYRPVVVAAGLTVDGRTALIRSRQHRAELARQATTDRTGIVTRLDPFATTSGGGDLPF
jgi:hypothetical protein